MMPLFFVNREINVPLSRLIFLLNPLTFGSPSPMTIGLFHLLPQHTKLAERPLP
jgi:hypothetical protein